MSAHPTDPTTAPPTRRAALRAGGLGVLGAAFLAACGSEGREPGVAGTPPTTPETPPTVPPLEPNELDLEADDVQLQTARTLELLVAETYGELGPGLDDPDARALAERFEADHEAIADDLADGAPQTEESSQPNEFVRENTVDPIRNSLVDDRTTLDFLSDLESALTATYINAVGILTAEEWRQRVVTYGAASARRVVALRGGGSAAAPTQALYPLDDLIPGEAYLLSPTDAALAADAEAEEAADAEAEADEG